ncbi:hypothetical protein P4O66_020794, partial [Electrophorus voltai]
MLGNAKSAGGTLPVMENALVRHDSPQHRRGQKRKMSLTRVTVDLHSCDTCDGQEAKYRCPSCLKYSCSLACVKQHKLVIGCSGVRDQTAFVPLAQFEEINLLNDYRFLEETARVADMPRRDALLHGPPHHVRLAMARKSARMAKVTLKLLPKSFSRHRENTTFYSKAFPRREQVWAGTRAFRALPSSIPLAWKLLDYRHFLPSRVGSAAFPIDVRGSGYPIYAELLRTEAVLAPEAALPPVQGRVHRQGAGRSSPPGRPRRLRPPHRVRPSETSKASFSVSGAVCPLYITHMSTGCEIRCSPVCLNSPVSSSDAPYRAESSYSTLLLSERRSVPVCGSVQGVLPGPVFLARDATGGGDWLLSLFGGSLELICGLASMAGFVGLLLPLAASSVILWYHELDVNKSLRENMRYKTVLEYPEVHVVLKGHLEEYLTRFPGRSRTMDQSDSHRGSISVPMAPGAPPPREDRTVGTHAETELEEGEIRSDEEDEKDEHEHHGYGAGGVYQNVTVETDIGLPHDVKEKKMDDFKYSAIAEDQSVTMETQDQDSDVDDRVAADNDQSVTMETGVFPSSSHYVHLVDGDIGHLVDVDSLGNPIVQNVEDRPLLVEVGGKDQQDETGSTAIEETNGSVGTPDRPPGVDQRDTTGSAVIEETNVSVGTPNRPPVVDHRDTTGSAVIADTN